MKREEILSGLRRHHRMHLSIDPTCSHAPDCAGCIIFDNVRSALTREPAPAGVRPSRDDVLRSAAEAAEADAHPDPMDFPTLTFVEPAPCPHRELEREALKATLEAALRWTRGSRTGWSRSYLTAQLEARIAALAQPCAAPGEPSQEDFDGMQRWLDDALRRCRDDDHKRLKYLQADVRILAAARRWVARAAPATDCKHREVARKLCQRLHTVECGVECTDLCRDAYGRIDRACAPGEAGEEWELWHCGNNSEDVQFFASQAPKDGPYRVYRRRAPEREGDAR